MAGPVTKPSGAFWGSTWEEFAHNEAVPFNATYFPQVERQGAVGASAVLHKVVDCVTDGIPAHPAGGTKALKITMPPSGGATSRYQLSGFWKTVVPGDDHWVCWTDYLGADWNIATSQLTNNGTTFTALGHTLRNVGTGDNGPLCYNADFTTRLGTPQRQAGLNLSGGIDNNGDSALQKGILDDVVKQRWTDWMVHYIPSRVSDGRVEFFRRRPTLGETTFTLVHTITGQNFRSTATGWQNRLGFYHGPSINHTRSWYVSYIAIGPTRASVELALGSSTAAAPAVPVGLGLAYAGGTFTATWSRNATGTAVADYVIERKIGPGPWKQQAVVAQPTSGTTVQTTFTHTPQDGTVQQARVAARAADGTSSAPSVTASATATQGALSDTYGNAILSLFPNLVADWPNDSSSGTTLPATIGPAGAYGGGVADAVPQPGWLSPIPSDPNQAHRYFDGNDVAGIPAGPDLDYGNGPLTAVVALRRDRTATPAGQDIEQIINKGVNAYAIGFIGGKATAHIGGTATPIVSESGTTNDLNPHLFIFELTPTTRRIWKDNVDVSVPGPAPTLIDTADALGLGSGGSGIAPGRNWFNGALRVSLVRGTLTQADRDRLWAAFNDNVPPAAPTGCDATETSGAPSQIAVSWTKPASQGDIARYDVYAQTDGGPFTPAGTITYAAALADEPNHAGLFRLTLAPGVFPVGHTYGFRVTATDLAGNESAPSAVDSVTLSTSISVPWLVRIL